MDISAEENPKFQRLHAATNRTLSVHDALALLEHKGIESRRHVQTVRDLADSAGIIDVSNVLDSTEPNILTKVLTNDLAMPDWSAFTQDIREIYDDIEQEVFEGENADYIHILADQNQDWFSVSVCTVDGQMFSYGNTEPGHMFSIQSCVKPLLYAAAVEENGLKKVHRHVGIEPSGLAFNEVSLNASHRPHNPMINAGAIATGSLIRPDLDMAAKFRYFKQLLSDVAGGEKVGFSQPTYLCEHETAWRNNALMYYMTNAGVFSSDMDPKQALDFYIQACSIEVNTRTAANIAATLATGGVCPLTGKRCFGPVTSKSTLTLMFSCGMYDYSGEWCTTIGLPAKSGVAGLVYVVIPHVMGIAVYSPPLDTHGNSVRGVEFCKRLLDRYRFGIFDQIVAGTRTSSIVRALAPGRRATPRRVGSQTSSHTTTRTHSSMTASRRTGTTGPGTNVRIAGSHTASSTVVSPQHVHTHKPPLSKASSTKTVVGSTSDPSSLKPSIRTNRSSALKARVMCEADYNGEDDEFVNNDPPTTRIGSEEAFYNAGEMAYANDRRVRRSSRHSVTRASYDASSTMTADSVLSDADEACASASVVDRWRHVLMTTGRFMRTVRVIRVWFDYCLLADVEELGQEMSLAQRPWHSTMTFNHELTGPENLEMLPRWLPLDAILRLLAEHGIGPVDRKHYPALFALLKAAREKSKRRIHDLCAAAKSRVTQLQNAMMETSPSDDEQSKKDATNSLKSNPTETSANEKLPNGAIRTHSNSSQADTEITMAVLEDLLFDLFPLAPDHFDFGLDHLPNVTGGTKTVFSHEWCNSSRYFNHWMQCSFPSGSAPDLARHGTGFGKNEWIYVADLFIPNEINNTVVRAMLNYLSMPVFKAFRRDVASIAELASRDVDAAEQQLQAGVGPILSNAVPPAGAENTSTGSYDGYTGLAGSPNSMPLQSGKPPSKSVAQSTRSRGAPVSTHKPRKATAGASAAQPTANCGAGNIYGELEIEELVHADPSAFGVSVCTIDGQQYSWGDADAEFPIMSAVQPLLYSLALKDIGVKETHNWVGTEPTSLDPTSFNLMKAPAAHGVNTTANATRCRPKPFNPFMDSGALEVCALLGGAYQRDKEQSFLNSGARFMHIVQHITELAGGRKVGFNNSVFLAQKEKRLQTLAVSHFMKGMGAYPPSVEPTDNAHLLFQAQSIEMSCDKLAVVAATFANIGVCPTTRQRVLEPELMRSIFSLMYNCGLNQYTGTWAFSVGIPASAGVSGAMMVIIPNIMGIAIYSPRLNEWGVPPLALHFCSTLTSRYRINIFDQLVYRDEELDIRSDDEMQRGHTVSASGLSQQARATLLFFELCTAASDGDAQRVQELIEDGANVNQCDYDKRTALHIAASDEHVEVVRVLVDAGANILCRDRWGNTPYDEAARRGSIDILSVLEDEMMRLNLIRERVYGNVQSNNVVGTFTGGASTQSVGNHKRHHSSSRHQGLDIGVTLNDFHQSKSYTSLASLSDVQMDSVSVQVNQSHSQQLYDLLRQPPAQSPTQPMSAPHRHTAVSSGIDRERKESKQHSRLVPHDAVMAKDEMIYNAPLSTEQSLYDRNRVSETKDTKDSQNGASKTTTFNHSKDSQNGASETAAFNHPYNNQNGTPETAANHSYNDVSLNHSKDNQNGLGDDSISHSNALHMDHIKNESTKRFNEQNTEKSEEEQDVGSIYNQTDVSTTDATALQSSMVSNGKCDSSNASPVRSPQSASTLRTPTLMSKENGTYDKKEGNNPN